MAERFPDDFNDLMETFKHSEDVLHDISAISRLTIADGASAKKVALAVGRNVVWFGGVQYIDIFGYKYTYVHM